MLMHNTHGEEAAFDHADELVPFLRFEFVKVGVVYGAHVESGVSDCYLVGELFGFGNLFNPIGQMSILEVSPLQKWKLVSFHFGCGKLL